MFIPIPHTNPQHNHPYSAVKSDIESGVFDNKSRTYELTPNEIDLLRKLHTRLNQDISHWNSQQNYVGIASQTGVLSILTGLTSTLTGLTSTMMFGRSFDIWNKTLNIWSIDMIISGTLGTCVGTCGCILFGGTIHYGLATIQLIYNANHSDIIMNDFYFDYNNILDDADKIIKMREEDTRP